MPNTTFDTKSVASDAVGRTAGLLARLADFGTVLPLPAPMGQICYVPMITAAPSVQSNPSNFEAAADSTIANIELQPEHICAVAHLAVGEQQMGATLSWLSASLMNSLADAIMSRATAAFTTANFSSTAWTGQPAAFDLAAVGACRTAIKTPRRCLLLGTACFNAIAQYLEPVGNRWTLPGFVAVHEVDGLPSGVLGAVCDPSCLTVGIGPAPSPEFNGVPQMEAVQVPGLGVQVQATLWMSLPGRAVYLSFDCNLAIKPAQTSKGALLLSS